MMVVASASIMVRCLIGLLILVRGRLQGEIMLRLLSRPWL